MTAFYRLSGSGNDFLALVEPSESPSARRIRAWCRRGLSMGADGVVVLRRSGEGARIEYFNSDGGAAELCLNATRCAVRLALDLGWAEKQIDIRTEAGVIPGRLTTSGEVALLVEAPPPPCPTELTVGDARHAGWTIAVGVPHFVLPWPETLEVAPVAELGSVLRAHPDLAPAGANVDFVRFIEPHRLEIRTFERGVESETLACGTGVLAAVAVGLESDDLSLPVAALTLGGFTLRVDAADRPSEHWSLQGDARMLCRGELLAGAEELPQPPEWS